MPNTPPIPVFGTPVAPTPTLVQIDAALLQQMLDAAAERGAAEALRRIGLADELAGDDVRELRNLLSAWRSAKRDAWSATVKAVTTAVLAAIAAGVAVRYGLASDAAPTAATALPAVSLPPR